MGTRRANRYSRSSMPAGVTLSMPSATHTIPLSISVEPTWRRSPTSAWFAATDTTASAAARQRAHHDGNYTPARSPGAVRRSRGRPAEVRGPRPGDEKGVLLVRVIREVARILQPDARPEAAPALRSPHGLDHALAPGAPLRVRAPLRGHRRRRPGHARPAAGA